LRRSMLQKLKPPAKKTSGSSIGAICSASTRPTTIQWSPAGCSAAIAHSSEARFRALLGEMQAALMSGRRERGRDLSRVAAAIALALAFTTWHSLTRQAELGDGEAIALMATTVEGADHVTQPADSAAARPLRGLLGRGSVG
jgi:hypothetical protein